MLVTFGLLAILYVAYSLWFTNAVVEAQNRISAERLVKEFSIAQPQVVEETPPAAIEETSPTPVFVPVDPFGLVYIPRLKSDVWAEPLVQGVFHRALSSGIGHYPTTEMPGEVGNFAIAGHRATNGEPFARFERLQQGDSVFIRTKNGWFEYKLVKDKIIQPDEVWVLSDSPEGQGFEPGASLISLTTCDPRFNSYQRWVWWGELVGNYPQDETPKEIQEAQ